MCPHRQRSKWMSKRTLQQWSTLSRRREPASSSLNWTSMSWGWNLQTRINMLTAISRVNIYTASCCSNPKAKMNMNTFVSITKGYKRTTGENNCTKHVCSRPHNSADELRNICGYSNESNFTLKCRDKKLFQRKHNLRCWTHFLDSLRITWLSTNITLNLFGL